MNLQVTVTRVRDGKFIMSIIVPVGSRFELPQLASANAGETDNYMVDIQEHVPVAERVVLAVLDCMAWPDDRGQPIDLGVGSYWNTATELAKTVIAAVTDAS